MRSPEVDRAINAVTAALSGAGVPKSRTNPSELYQYRSIDNLQPRLGHHQVFYLSVTRTTSGRTTSTYDYGRNSALLKSSFC